ncbi:LacI family DNA-binding transcriptional regulator [Candidatus Poribacteria bacterium]
MAVTLYDVAKQAGVNASTVSRALNDKANVNEGTKKRIHQIAQTLGYYPNRVARSLATQETRTLGLVMPAMRCLGHTLFCSMLEGIYEEVQNLGYSLSFSVVNIDTQGEETAIRKLEEYRVDGLILGWFKEKYVEESRLAKLAQDNIPFVVIGDRHLSSQSINMITCDNFLGAYKATRHLIDLGHEKIAVISSSTRGPIANDRFGGFRAALKSAGIHYSEEDLRRFVREGESYKSGSGEAAMHSLLDSGGDFTAVFAFSDMFAAEAIRAIQQRGYHVPDDYAVVGFDGTEYGALLNPGLTTVEQPYRAIGREAVRMLRQLIDKGKLAKSCMLIEPQLIVRESCGVR